MFGSLNLNSSVPVSEKGAHNSSNNDTAQANKSPFQLLKDEIKADFQEQDATSLQIWKMFNNKNTLLPNNKRILNLSWRLNSLNAVKKRKKSSSISSSGRRSKLMKNSACKTHSSGNLMLLKQHDSENIIRDHSADKASDNPEFDYIEHIRRISKEEYGINPDLNKDISMSSSNHSPNDPTSFNTSNPINIDFEGKGLEYFSPETSHSLSSNTNSVFSVASTRPSSYHNLAAAPPQQQYSLPQMNAHAHTFNQMQQMQLQHQQQHARTNLQQDDFNVDNFLKFDDNFNELMDFSKFDEEKPSPDSKKKLSNSSAANDESDYNLSSYINTLETSLDTQGKMQHQQQQQQQQSSKRTPQTYPTPSSLSSPALLQPAKLQALPAFSAAATSSVSSTNKLSQPTCENCFTSTTPLWRKTSDNRLLCNACGLFFKLHGVIRPPLNAKSSSNPAPVGNKSKSRNNSLNHPVTAPASLRKKRSYTESNNVTYNTSTSNLGNPSLSAPSGVKPSPMVNTRSFKSDNTQMGEALGGDWDWLKFNL